MKHWNCQFSLPDFGKTISLTWIAKNQHGVNNFDGFSSFSSALLMLPVQHGKQNHDENSVKTLEVSLSDVRWRHLKRFNAIFIMILAPMLHGKHIFAYGANRFLCFFALQGSLGRTKPSKCLSVFAVKLQWNAVFRWLAEACFFV